MVIGYKCIYTCGIAAKQRKASTASKQPQQASKQASKHASKQASKHSKLAQRTSKQGSKQATRRPSNLSTTQHSYWLQDTGNRQYGYIIRIASQPWRSPRAAHHCKLILVCLSLAPPPYLIYIYIYMCRYICVYIYIYTYI